MNITARARVEFCFQISDEQVEILCACSETHYDSACRKASKEGEFIHRWKSMNAMYKNHGVESNVTATFSHFDLCCKILEEAPYHGLSNSFTKEQVNEARALQIAMQKAMHQANDKIHTISFAVE